MPTALYHEHFLPGRRGGRQVIVRVDVESWARPEWQASGGKILTGIAPSIMAQWLADGTVCDMRPDVGCSYGKGMMYLALLARTMQFRIAYSTRRMRSATNTSVRVPIIISTAIAIITGRRLAKRNWLNR